MSSTVSNGMAGNRWLVFNLQKTGKISLIPLLEPALDIIDKQINHPSAVHLGKVFPSIPNQKVNSSLKDIGDICGK